MSENSVKELKIVDGLRSVWPPIISFLGLTGNILSIIVLAQSNYRKTSTGVLLLTLAVTDTFVLLQSVLFEWILYIGKIDYLDSSQFGCKTNRYLTYFTLQVSSWILVLVTAERLCSVQFPHKVKEYFARNRVIIGTVIVITILGFINLHLLTGSEVTHIEQLNKTQCFVREDHIHFMLKVWPWIDFCLVFAIPFCVLLFGNITIIVKLKRRHMFRRATRQVSTNSQVTTSSSFRGSLRSSIHMFTIMAVALNVTFAVFVSPANVFFIGQPYWFDLTHITKEAYAKLVLTQEIVSMLNYINNSINFLLYILSSPKFRRDLMKLLRRVSKIKLPFSKRAASRGTTESTFSAIESTHKSSTMDPGDVVL